MPFYPIVLHKNISLSYFFIKPMRNPLLKPLNAIAASYSYMAGSFFGKTSAVGMPIAAGIELTNYCNLKCPECNSGSGLMTRSRGYMNPGLFEKIISELGPYLYNVNLYFQGESMMHPQFFPILALCRNIHSTVSTNGHFLSMENAEEIVRSGLNKLIISLDGMDKVSYSSYRVNGDFDKVVKGIKNIAEARDRNSSPLKVVIQFLVNRNNENQIKAVKKFAADMNASLYLKSMQIIDRDSYDTWLPSMSRYSRYKKEGAEWEIKSNLPDRCARLWFNPVITWDGKVIPCCFDKDADYLMGDMNEESFSDIWNGSKYRLFRKKIVTRRSAIKICRNCTSGLFRRS
jgi:radical SAM protein with 4Fe4S-binding SPASM domain